MLAPDVPHVGDIAADVISEDESADSGKSEAPQDAATVAKAARTPAEQVDGGR
jgi:hypothetical protein